MAYECEAKARLSERGATADRLELWLLARDVQAQMRETSLIKIRMLG